MVVTKTTTATTATTKETSPPRSANAKAVGSNSAVRPSLSVKSISSSRSTVAAAVLEQQQGKQQFSKQTSVSEQRLERQANTARLQEKVNDGLTTTTTKEGEIDLKSELQKCDTTTAAAVVADSVSGPNATNTSTAAVDQPSKATTESENRRLSAENAKNDFPQSQSPLLSAAAADIGTSTITTTTFDKSKSCDSTQPPQQSPSSAKLNIQNVQSSPSSGNLRRGGQLLLQSSRGLGSGRDNALAPNTDVDMLRLASANSRRVRRQQQTSTTTITTSQSSAKTGNRSRLTLPKSPNSTLLAFIEKSSPELIFLLSESAKLSYNLCQFEAKLDYLEQIFCRKGQQSKADVVGAVLDDTGKLNGGQKSSSPEHQSSNSSNHKGSWSSVIKRTRNWIDGVRSKNVLLEKRPEKKALKSKDQLEKQLKLASKNQKLVGPYKHQTEENRKEGEEAEAEATSDDSNDSSSSVHSSEDELILLLDRIIKFSSNIVSRLNPADRNDQEPSDDTTTKAEEKLLNSAENVITTTKCDSESTSDGDTTTVVSERRKAVLQVKQLSADSDTFNNNNNSGDSKSDPNDSNVLLTETLSSLSAESTAKGNRYEWLQSLPSNVKDLMGQLFPTATNGKRSSEGAENTDPNTAAAEAAANFERIYELNPELLKALIENVKTNARLVQLRREFDRLMCSHLKAIGHEVKSSGSSCNGKGKKSSSSSTQKNSTPAKRKKANDETLSAFEKSPSRERASKFAATASANNNCCCHQQQQQQQPEQLNSSESSKSNTSNHQHQNHHLMVSDGDSGGEFTATTVTNDFGTTNNNMTTTTNAALKTTTANSSSSPSNSSSTVNTDDELSSLLNQIAVCSAKIIEQQQQQLSGSGVSGGGNGVASCSSSNNSNSTSSSSGCCCSSASLIDGSAGNGMAANGKCASSNSLSGGVLPNGWSTTSHHPQHHHQSQLHLLHSSQSPPQSVQLKKCNMRHNSSNSTNMLSAVGGGSCSCEQSSLKNCGSSQQMYSPSHHLHHHQQQQLINRNTYHWSHSSMDEDGNYPLHHQLHSPPPPQMYGSRANVAAALKRSAGMTALNETSNSAAAPFTLGDHHMTGFMFAPSAMDLLSSAASCSSVVIPATAVNGSGAHHPSSIGHPHHPHHPHPHLGHYRHHSSSGSILRGAQLQAFANSVDHSNLHYLHQQHPHQHQQQQQQPPLYNHLQNMHLTGEPEMSANAFIFDPNVDVESFLNEVEKELDDNCYASAPPFMARNAAMSQNLPPTMAGNSGLVDEASYAQLSPHRYLHKTGQHSNPIGSDGQHGTAYTFHQNSPNHRHHHHHHHHQQQQQANGHHHLNASSSTLTLVNSKQLQPENGVYHGSLNSSSSSSNWRLKASTHDLASSNSSNQTLTTNNPNNSPNTAGAASTATSHFPFPSTASMPLTSAELLRGVVGHHQQQCSSGGGGHPVVVAPSSPGGESQRYRRLIVPSASRDLLDNFRAQVSHRVAAETDSQLRQVEQWFQEQVQASMVGAARQSSGAGAGAGSMAPESSSESFSFSGGSHQQQQQQLGSNNNNNNILLSADRRRFSADDYVKQSNINNSDLIYFG